MGVKLKNRINVSKLEREAIKHAQYMYEESWEPTLQVWAFMEGVKFAVKELRDGNKKEGR